MTDDQEYSWRSEWDEERLRYNVLSTIYERAGASCESTVIGTEVGTVLDLKHEDLFRVIHFLEYNGYLKYLGAGPRVCITDKGLRYVEEIAGRRRSLRNPERRRASTAA